nr:hypothetical protein [bacterium]
MEACRQDRLILRELATRYMEIASDSIQQARMLRYRQSNAMQKVKPIVLIDEVPWGEMDLDGSLTLACTDPDCRHIERWLRRKLFQWRYFQADHVFLPYYPVRRRITGNDIGLDIQEQTLDTAPSGAGIISHHYLDQLADESALEAIGRPQVTVDMAATLTEMDKIDGLIGDILPPRIEGESVYCAIWDLIPRYHGVENSLMDLYDRPEFIHAMMGRFTDFYQELYRQYEQLNLFEAQPLTLHCTPALTFDLPGPDFDGQRVCRHNVWARGMAQIFSSVSPAMHEEFDLQYLRRIFEPFGLVYYGCCEPLDGKIDLLRSFKNLRKISITAWANVQAAAEKMGGDFVLSYKPNPAFVATTVFDPQPVLAQIRTMLKSCRQNGTQCEIILKDISTVCGRPQNLIDWEKAIMQLVEEEGYY